MGEVKTRVKIDEPCKFFSGGDCINGLSCRYSHDLQDFPCYEYHVRKNCDRPHCRYSHDEPLTEDEKGRFVKIWRSKFEQPVSEGGPTDEMSEPWLQYLMRRPRSLSYD